ncbi:Fur family transcriptional regulator [Halalkalibacterium halodurans]|uniref:Fur family transcriptional regulator n=1 Tax=Halalkalibacterium halodurans TaxID=86665 RepID=UPI002E1EE2A1|nr:Fur family transcriptional regulator [Halalkalibacterium halodurans]
MDRQTHLLNSGLRITGIRLSILDTIERLDHPTSKEIFEELRKNYKSVSLATVYYNLKILLEKKVVFRISDRYDLHDDHYHTICKICGNVEDFNYPSLGFLVEIANEITSFNVEEHELKLVGLCKECCT